MRSIPSGGLGIRLAVIDLVRVVISLRHCDTWVDDLPSLNVFLFLAALIAAYLSLRRPRGDRMHRLERIADAAFLLVVTTLALNCSWRPMPSRRGDQP